MIDTNQWEMYETKYGKLMHKISRSISGDEVISAIEDNYGDLCIAALDSIKGFNKKTGQSFDDMFGTKLFDQYTKTCLWHVKGNKGAKITKKYPITKRTVSLQDHPEVFSLSGKENNSVDTEDFLTALSNGFTELEKGIVSAIVQNPEYINDRGRIIFSKVSRCIGCSIFLVKKALNSIESKLKFEL
jgi:hypothetical protein|tara:strand:+ start:8060 stop:8620 length:561 start_codon:yes stop_codon:yes gene_type:complete